MQYILCAVHPTLYLFLILALYPRGRPSPPPPLAFLDNAWFGMGCFTITVVVFACPALPARCS